MGLRLSFGAGPLRASIPLTGGHRRRSRPRGKVWHGSMTLPNGKKWKCLHNHRTEQAAIDCANKHQRMLGPAPVGRARPLRSADFKPLLAALAAVDSADSALAFTGRAVRQLNSLASPVGKAFEAFKDAAVAQTRAETHRLGGIVNRANAEAEVASQDLRARMKVAREAGDKDAQAAIWQERDSRQAEGQGKIDAASARLDDIKLQIAAVKSVGEALGVLK